MGFFPSLVLCPQKKPHGVKSRLPDSLETTQWGRPNPSIRVSELLIQGVTNTFLVMRLGSILLKKTYLQSKSRQIAMSNVVKLFAPTMSMTFILRVFAVTHLLCTEITDLIFKTASQNFLSLAQKTCSR